MCITWIDRHVRIYSNSNLRLSLVSCLQATSHVHLAASTSNSTEKAITRIILTPCTTDVHSCHNIPCTGLQQPSLFSCAINPVSRILRRPQVLAEFARPCSTSVVFTDYLQSCCTICRAAARCEGPQLPYCSFHCKWQVVDNVLCLTVGMLLELLGKLWKLP